MSDQVETSTSLLKRLLHQWRFIENEIDLVDQRLEQLGEQDPVLAAAVARWSSGDL